ncbi:type II toxin-antitoxin system HicB family antitoxin [Acinetobacter baumannii]|uniref:type II toxin-antitoxin system HicB family antitoxin n=1 Tax=Acinetobacter baumannii TaxID=470 RepID=UPI0021BDDEFB|nr:type II toxin-antitoxin system HicB family antitoxin [Acinetobacter baumannii]MDC4673949.1 type II toxin-antitoxin system HicB family antitoxin [Acinetobacter baumannii]MDC5549896.1 type II toxin-antitoxin system HicB family antitoxin [Acinetobacter baumannii]MDV7565316.1 type II toxin-antitoxin system HicB family antitoxin [Acinetobacter baumannii]
MYYSVAVEKGDENNAFGVTVPDIPGCFSAGDTFEEALQNVKEAIARHLELLAEAGEEIPLASNASKFIDLKEYQGYIWAVVDIDVSRYLGKSEKINVTLPSRLIHMIDDKVKSDSRFKSRSAFLAAGAEQLLRT